MNTFCSWLSTNFSLEKFIHSSWLSFGGYSLTGKIGIVFCFGSFYIQSPIITILFQQKLRLLEELEDTWLPYLTPKDDEFYQQVRSFNIFVNLHFFFFLIDVIFTYEASNCGLGRFNERWKGLIWSSSDSSSLPEYVNSCTICFLLWT